MFDIFVLALTLTAHAVFTWWTLHQRAHWTRWMLTQAPPLVMYGLLYWWYLVPWSIEDGGPPPLWVLPWAGLTLTAFAWLWVWWLDHANQ